ncbi:coiled-coil domain-containing protein 17 isoform X2 [Hyperolius riggenbachi]|uniref:coiled-coil domain-containing protein 17 isoform X2 n=1 Tax=Hyperolius riggenbachi TaxID=752182 RepID=UPI0035A2CC46
MDDLGSYRCHNCNMAFRSYPLLEKHREKFCIGSKIGDPTVLSSGAFTHLPDAQDLKTRDSVVRLRARESLLNEREQRLMDAPLDSVSDSKALRSLTEEFHKLRKSLEVSVPTLRSFQGDTSLCPPWDREYRERMFEMAEAHERHLADIQARNQALEMQREEIRQRLSDVASSSSSTSNIEQMLLELKAQEEKNQLALDALRDQVILIQSESSALQLAYVQSSGSDPVVLAQMRDLQAEALAFEELSNKQERKQKKKKRHDGAPRTLDVELMAVEMENQRLEEEILNLKLLRNRKKMNNEDSEIAEMQREHIQQMAQLQADIELLRRDVGRMPPRPGHGPPPFQPPPFQPPLPPPALLPNRQPMGKPEPAVMMGVQDSLLSPNPAGNRHILEPLDALGPAPYDPVAGFVIFYDFLLGLDATFRNVRLLSGLYSNGHRMGQPSSLPDAPCEMWNPPIHLANVPRGNIAMLSSKQPIPRVRPSSSIALVMELQAAGGFNTYGQEIQQLSSSGWTKLDLFDHHNQVQSGRWKLPVRALPLRPGLSTGQLNTVPQVGKAELYLRIVNARDADLQSMAEIDPRNSSLYQYPLLMPNPAAAAIIDNPAPLPNFHQPPNSFQMSLSPYTDYVDPPPVQEIPNQLRASQRDDSRVEEGHGQVGSTEDRVGFIIDRVTDAPPGDGTLRLVGYHMNTGQVIRTHGKGMSCIISAVSSSVKQGCFMFGEQEAVFRKVPPQEDMLLVLRFYHWPGGSTAWAPWQHRRSLQPLLASEEWAAAWSVLRLTRPASPDRDSVDAAGHHLVWNTGVHDLPLYHCPAPPVLSLSGIHPEKYTQIFEQYGNARVRFCVFHTIRPDDPFPPDSPAPIHSNMAPEGAFILHSRRKPIDEPYSPADGITMFIDGARFLPDAVTVTRVTGRIFDKNFDQFGPDISTGIDLNSDIFNPYYKYFVQINSTNIPPTSTLLLKVYTIDRFSRELVLIGWAALKLFVESETHKEPTSDSAEVQVSLNEGPHQIRLYHRSPPTDRPFSAKSLASSGRIVPCATLLVRIKKSRSQHQAENLMTTVECPEYLHGVYFSETAQPTSGEILLYSAMIRRSVVQVREVIPALAGTAGQELMSDTQLSDWLHKTFTERMKESPSHTPPFKLCCVSQYLVTPGMTVSLDMAQNLPWSGFTLAHICFNPPGALYYGDPWMKYDRAVPVDDIDLDAAQNCPVWQDGFKTFTRRIFHKYLTLIIHLHEVVTLDSARGQPDNEQATLEAKEDRTQKFKPGSQAWTALRVFYKNYCNMGAFQLPLYQGAPTLSVLHALRSGNCQAKLEDLEQRGLILRIKAASVTVRITDGRRREEMETYDAQDITQLYPPEDYTAQPNVRKLQDLVPSGEEEFKKQLVNWFREYLTSDYRPPAIEGN